MLCTFAGEGGFAGGGGAGLVREAAIRIILAARPDIEKQNTDVIFRKSEPYIFLLSLKSENNY
jgi:hypothetical protein